MTTSNLSHTLNRWILRLRTQRAVTWSLRGLIAGLAFTLITGSIGLYRERLLRVEFLFAVAASAIVFPLVASLFAFLWRIKPLDAARHFDLQFKLNERVSTALELQASQTNIPAEMIQHQLADALQASSHVDVRRSLPLHWKTREIMTALVCVALIGTVWLRGDQWFNAALRARTVEKAVAEESAEIEKLIEQIEANDALTEEQKEELTQALEQAQQSLNDNPSLENSVSVLTSTGEKLESMSDAQTEQTSQALKEVGSQLSGQENSPLQSVGEQLAQGDVISAATELQNINVDQLSAQEQQQLAEQLESMAQSLSSTNPQLADQLNQAAQALKSGDTASAQQALNNAAQALAQAGQQITFAQAAGQAADQVQEGAGQVLAAGGGTQQANQTGQGTNQGQGQGQSSNGIGGSGAGTGSGDGQTEAGSEAGSDPIDQNNGPGDGGETTYEQIYAPTLLGGEGGPVVGLPNEGSGEGEVIGQGPTTPGAEGTSTVPYNDVYSQYEQFYNQAIENGEVPSQFLQIIKNYFDSLEP